MGNQKAQGLPVNVVVMLIIGIIIFGLGMGLFRSISNEGSDIVNDLNSQIKADISNLECDGEDWICSPSYKMDKSGQGKFSIFIANKGDSARKYSIIIGDGSTNPYHISKEGCEADIFYPNIAITVKSGESAQLPFIVKNPKISKKCSLVTTATLVDDIQGATNEKASVIIRVE